MVEENGRYLKQNRIPEFEILVNRVSSSMCGCVCPVVVVAAARFSLTKRAFLRGFDSDAWIYVL